jgi:hypothetical protein
MTRNRNGINGQVTGRGSVNKSNHTYAALRVSWILAMPVSLCEAQQRSVTLPGDSVAVWSQRLRVADSATIALRAQNEEIRRASDRLASFTLWALGLFGSGALAIAIFGWWSSKRVHDRDIDKLRDDHRKEIALALETARNDLNAGLATRLQQAITEYNQRQGTAFANHQAEAIAVIKLAEVAWRRGLGEFDASLRAAGEAYHAAVAGNTNYPPHVLSAVKETLAVAGERLRGNAAAGDLHNLLASERAPGVEKLRDEILRDLSRLSVGTPA